MICFQIIPFQALFVFWLVRVLVLASWLMHFVNFFPSDTVYRSLFVIDKFFCFWRGWVWYAMLTCNSCPNVLYSSFLFALCLKCTCKVTFHTLLKFEYQKIFCAYFVEYPRCSLFLRQIFPYCILFFSCFPVSLFPFPLCFFILFLFHHVSTL